MLVSTTVSGGSLGDAEEFLRALYRDVPEGFIELRPIRRGAGAFKPEFFDVGAPEAFVRRALELAPIADVYYGVAPRARQASTKDAVGLVPAAWVDADTEDAVARLSIELWAPPSFIIASGTGRHAYWLFTSPISAERVERINRALARRYEADERVFDAGRILRLPNTLNHKSDPPVRVELLEAAGHRYAVEDLETELAEELAAEPATKGRKSVPVARVADRDEVSPPVENILGRLRGVRRTTNGWTAHCPAHDDETPSLSIKEGDDGRVLMKCHAGCESEAVVAAVGLTMADLFVRDDDTESAGHDDRKIARVVVALADDEGVELFHDAQRNAYASFSVDASPEVADHHETHRIDSKEFGLWLRGLYFKHCDGALSDATLKEAAALLAARAIFAGPQRDVHRRIAGDLDRIYIDLGDPAWRVVEVTAMGRRVLDRAPVVFVRDGTSQALPEPEPAGSLDELRALTNFDSDSAWVIFRGALIGAFHPHGPYLLLLLLGPEGTAKTTTAKHFFGRFTDPQLGAFPVGTPSTRDIAVSALASRVVGFDNVGAINPKLSDLLCQLISGGGIRERELYTNAGIFAGELRVLIVMTARTLVVREADLIDRTVTARLRPLEEHERREETEVLAELTRIERRVFGGLLDAIAGALREYPDTRPPRLPRLADMTRFVTAAEKAMGWDVGSFQAALSEIQADSLVESIENSPYAMAAVAFMDGHDDWAGTSSELLAALSQADTAAAQQRTWPKAPAQATKELDRNTHVLLAHGVEYTRYREPGSKRQRIITLTKVQRDAGHDGTAP